MTKGKKSISDNTNDLYNVYINGQIDKYKRIVGKKAGDLYGVSGNCQHQFRLARDGLL